MSDTVVAAIAGALFTTIGGLALFLVEQGGRRRRLRRELRENLELAALLDSRPVAQQRLNRTIDKMVERYAPPARVAAEREAFRVVLMSGLGLLATALLALGVADVGLSLEASLGLGAAIAVVANLVGILVQRRRDDIDFVAVYEEALNAPDSDTE